MKTTQKHKITYLDTNKIKEYKKNPRIIDDNAVKTVADSITAYGFTVPIVVDKDNEIISGHTRLRAAKLLRLAEVPVIVREDLSEDEARAFRILDNKTSELASWDMPMLYKELKKIDDELLTGFTKSDVDNNLRIFTEGLGSLPEKEYSEKNIILTNKCPKCKYEW